MSARIHLSRRGGKKRPFYRIVVSHSGSPRDGRYLEQVGTYDPKAASGAIQIDREKLAKWLSRGAQPSQTVSELIKKIGKGSADSTDGR